MTNYFAIIPAAGIGTRMHADCPKQYLKIHGEMILARVINTFSNISSIQKIVVALHPDDHWWPTLSLSHPEKVMTVIGGKERVDSVLLALQFLENTAKNDDFILVHDAVRVGITEKNILTLMKEIKDHPVGGLLGLPVVDTIKKIDEKNTVEKTISREQLWAAQTPQCFRYQLLMKAIQNALSDNQLITDESSAIEYAGHHPKMIMGDVRNFKITFPEDLVLAEKLL